MVVPFLAHALFGKVLGIAAQQNIRSAPRHVGGDSYGAVSARLRYNFRLALVVLRVQNIMLYTVAAQQS